MTCICGNHYNICHGTRFMRQTQTYTKVLKTHKFSETYRCVRTRLFIRSLPIVRRSCPCWNAFRMSASILKMRTITWYLSSSCCSEPQCAHVQLSPFYHPSTLDVTHVIPGPPHSLCNQNGTGLGKKLP